MSKVTIYAGTTHDTTGGIYRFQLDTLKGVLEGPWYYYECACVRALHFHHFALLISCIKEGKATITYLDTHQTLPQHLDSRTMMDELDCAVTQDDQRVYTANDKEGIVVIYRKEKGKLKLEKRLKLGEQSGCCQVLLHHNIFYVVCRGFDRIKLFDQEQQEDMKKEIRLPDGSGPTQILIDQNGEYLYVLCEAANEVFVYQIGRNGLFHCQQICTLLPKGYKDTCSSRKIVLSPNGKYLYALIDGLHAIACFEIIHGNLKQSGMIQSGGLNPYDALIDETGRWMIVLHKDSDNVIVFQMNPDNGEAVKITDEKILTRGVHLTLAYRI